ncbi:MAG: c-type cytochrome [Oligoflexia bacterium]|nr:c-type cytochrome [Oligoflexia bacterium]
MKKILMCAAVALVTYAVVAQGQEGHPGHPGQPPGHGGAEHFEQYCSGCHGSDGISGAEHIPNLAGQKKEYIALQLRDFRDKKRPGTVMPAMAANLQDSHIEGIAAFVSSLGCGR